MINVYVLNSSKKYIEKLKKENKYNVSVLENKQLEEYEKEISSKIEKDNKLYFDYLRLYIIYKNGGLLLDGNFEIVYNLSQMFQDEVFLGFNNTNTIATNILYSKSSQNNCLKLLLDTILENSKAESITDIFSIAFNIDIGKKINTSIVLNDDVHIYAYDYFYPIDYEKNGKQFSENTKAIYYNPNQRLGYRQKTKLKVYKKYGPAGSKYLNTMWAVFRFNLASKKYAKQQKIGIGVNNDKLNGRVNDAIKLLDEYKKKNVNYIIIHNPCWMGVTSATKELFENLVPLEELYTQSKIDELARKICDIGVEQVIFSAFNLGWDKLARKIKEYNPNIKLKVFWHGSHSQVIQRQNWTTNVMALNLQKKGIIDVFATCKESMLNFYKFQGYDAFFLKNTVNLDQKLLNDIMENKEKNKNDTNKKLKIGMYSANMDWRKNMFNQLAAASLIPNSEICSIPLNFDAEVFCSKVNESITGTRSGVPREELLRKMSENDINLYVTFSECAPMLPIESMEVGTLCITGNNHHYFKGTQLEEYLVVDREDDVISIVEKIKYALENKEKIFELYRKWKNDYDVTVKNSVEEFLKL